MGFAISWLAVSGKSPDSVLAELGLAREGATEDFPGSELTGASLPSGWYLVFSNRFDSPLVSEQSLQGLSQQCRVIACQVEEHVMFSSAACFENGELIWRAEHDAQKSIYHLSTSGTLPTGFTAIFDSFKQQQDEEGGSEADVDFIHDVPLTLAQTLVGFKHDESGDRDPKTFEVLRNVNGTAKPWWKFW